MNQDTPKKNGRTKAPAFQFYAMDWLTDPSLRLCSPETRGVWIDLLCFMFLSNEPGILMVNDQVLDEHMIQKFAGIDSKIWKKVWAELNGFGIIKRDAAGRYFSKRMIEDERIRQIRRDCGSLGGNPKLKANARILDNQKKKQKQTPSSSSSSSKNMNDKSFIYETPFSDFIKKNCPEIQKIKNQLTNDQANTLLATYTHQEIEDILLAMENFKDVAKKYGSIYLTAANWLKRRTHDTNSKNKHSNSGSKGRPDFTDTIRNF
jgi:hypothetical protein